MVRIADSAVETVRTRVDIAELVREYVPNLRRSGRNLKACCPFHQEKTPSFLVNPEKQIFHCFGCGEGGDAFTFLMKMESLNFMEAVQKLADRVGVQIAPAADSLSPREKEGMRIREALAFAADFYHKVLITAPEAEVARQYLKKRCMNDAARDRFSVGFALSNGNSFMDAAIKKGFPPDILQKAGLVALREGTGRYRDYFWGRIVYPIRGVRGDIIGFGARAMGDAQPKYLNSPDTVAFSKGRVLYGLFEGLPDIRKSRRVLLMEGYMDVIAAHQFGMVHACAPLGTAVTLEHADLLKRYSDEAVIVFDPDNAGAAASLRGAQILLEKGLTVRIATIPGGLDPDELLHKDGVQALQSCIQNAQDLPDFQTTQMLKKQTGTMSAEAKAKMAQEILATINKAPDEILKDEWIRRLAQRLLVDEQALRRELGRAAETASLNARPSRFTARTEAKPAPPAPMPVDDRDMLRALLMQPQLDLSDEKIADRDFESEKARRIFTKVRDLNADRPLPIEPASRSRILLEALAPEDASEVRVLLVGEMEDREPGATLAALVEKSRLIRRYRELHSQWETMQAGPVNAAVAEEYQQVLKKLADLRLLDLAKRRLH